MVFSLVAETTYSQITSRSSTVETKTQYNICLSVYTLHLDNSYS